MRKFITGFVFFSSLLFLHPLTSNSQGSTETKAHEFWHRVSVGGNFGFQFGTITSVVISPEIKIRVVDQLHFGIGFNYQYLRYKDYFTVVNSDESVDLKANVYGGRIFARYYLSSLFDNALGNIFGHIEYEYLTYNSPYKYSGSSGSFQDPNNLYYQSGKQIMEFNSVFVGAGYSQALGGRAFLDLMILFNLNDSYSSPYTNPIFRLGFGIGL